MHFFTFRFYWKIVDNGNGKAVAFIGYNFPGPISNLGLLPLQKSACSAPIASIFNTTTNNNYIRHDAYGNGNNYGNIFACELANVKISEMIYVRDTFMGAPGTTWTLLTTA